MGVVSELLGPVSDWLAEERGLHDFVSISLGEADTRTPGGDHLLLGVERGTLAVCVAVLSEVDGRWRKTDYERVTEAYFHDRWPHAGITGPEDADW